MLPLTPLQCEQLEYFRDHILSTQQRHWVFQDHPVRLAIKSRRIGLTWTDGYRAVLDAIRGQDTTILANTAASAKEYIRPWKTLLSQWGWEELGWVCLETMIKAPNGAMIRTRSSSPHAIRGCKGNAVIDEYCFVKDLREMVEAATPLLMRGGKVRLISSPGLVDHYSYQLTTQNSYPVSWYPFDVCSPEVFVAVCRENGWNPTQERFNKWYGEILDNSTNPAQEYFCQFSRDSGVRFFKRFDTSNTPAPCTAQRWEAYNLPERLPFSGSILAAGLDLGFVEDPTSLCLITSTDQSTYQTHFYEFRGVEWEPIKRLIGPLLSRANRVAVDAGGLGEVPKQELTRSLGSKVKPCHTNTNWYTKELSRYNQALLDGVVRLPDDDHVTRDHEKVEAIYTGSDQVTAILPRYAHSSGWTRHCDSVVSAGLAYSVLNTGYTGLPEF